MQYKLHRIYDDGAPQGFRVLVDKIWPRGISKDEANLDAWWKEFAPEDELRKWFDHDVDKWDSFRKKYLHQLSAQKDEIKASLEEVDSKSLVLLYGAKDTEHTHAIVLAEYMKKLKL